MSHKPYQFEEEAQQPSKPHQISETDRLMANRLLADFKVANEASKTIRKTIENLQHEVEKLEIQARNKYKEAEALLLHPAYKG